VTAGPSRTKTKSKGKGKNNRLELSDVWDEREELFGIGESEEEEEEEDGRRKGIPEIHVTGV
jgi:hypothetical protein